jgi:hypothetical protein
MNAHSIQPCRLSMREIIELASGFTGVRVIDIVSQRREANIVAARYLAIYAIRDLQARSYPEIARVFGDRDHSTILHAYRSMTADILLDDETRRDAAAFLDVCRKATPLAGPDADPFEIARRICDRPALATNASVEIIQSFAAIVVAALSESTRQDEAAAARDAAMLTFNQELAVFSEAVRSIESATSNSPDTLTRHLAASAERLIAAARSLQT